MEKQYGAHTDRDRIIQHPECKDGDDDCTCWKRKSACCQMTLIAIPLLLLFTGVTVMTTMYTLQVNSPNQAICTTPDCVMAAGNMLAAMDQTAAPCDDFYQYSCGGFAMRNSVPAGQNKLQVFDFIANLIQKELRQLLESPPPPNEPPSHTKSRQYYHSCLNRDLINNKSVAAMQQLVNDIGGLYLTSSKNVPDTWDLDKLLAARNKYSISSFFSFGAGADDKNVSSNIIQINQGGLGLGQDTRDYYINKTVDQDQTMVAYATMLTTYAQLIVGQSNVDMSLVYDTLRFEQQLALIQQSQADMRDVNAIYHKVDINWLQQNAGFIQWLPFVNSLFAPIQFTVDGSQPVLLYATPYITKMVDLVKSTISTPEGRRAIQNYVVLMAVNDYGSKLGDDFQAAYNAFQSVYAGTQGTPETWQTCVTDTDATVGYPLGAMYVNAYFGADAKDKASNVIDNIISAFRDRVQSNPWMDAPTKQQALGKFDLLKHDVAFPSWINNETYLGAMYARLTVTNDYVNNQLAGFAYSNIQTATMVKNVATDPQRWTMTPPTVNAYYEPTQNKFVVPAGILNPTFFFKAMGVPDLINFAAIGTVTGHEITHGFDDQGAQYDKYGNLNNWWTNATLAEFNKRTKCLVDQYSAFPGPRFQKYSIGLNLRGEQTLGENIADNGGIRTSFQAYRAAQQAGKLNLPELVGLQNLTPDQLFFVGYAQVWCSIFTTQAMQQQILGNPHSPAMFRVIGPLQNSPDFTAAFNCPAGSNMNPDPNSRCSVW